MDFKSNKFKCHELKLNIFILFILTELSICTCDIALIPNALTKEVVSGIKNVIHYYNVSVYMAESVELVEKYFDIEIDSGIFMPAKLLQIPPEVENLENDLQKAEEYINGDIQSDTEDTATMVKQGTIENQLIFHFGYRHEPFKLRNGSPLDNAKKVSSRMIELWETILEEFQYYSHVQLKVVETYQQLQVAGLQLYPTKREPGFVTYYHKDVIQKLILNDFESRNTNLFKFSDLKMEARLQNQINNDENNYNMRPEINALQSFLEKEPLDQLHLDNLSNFIPNMNKKAVFIISKILSLEGVVNQIDDQVQKYEDFLVKKRESLHHQLNRVKNYFQVKTQPPKHQEL